MAKVNIFTVCPSAIDYNYKKNEYVYEQYSSRSIIFATCQIIRIAEKSEKKTLNLHKNQAMFQNLQFKPKLVSLAVLEELTDGSEELFFDMLKIFFLQVPVFIQDMEAAYEAKDYLKLGQIAHKAKSSVATMGITNLSAKMKDFELLAKSGKETESYRGYIDLFKETCQLAIAELETIKSNF